MSKDCWNVINVVFAGMLMCDKNGRVHGPCNHGLCT